jgi:hypothetical protein
MFSVSRGNLYAVNYLKENAAKSEYFIRAPHFLNNRHTRAV